MQFCHIDNYLKAAGFSNRNLFRNITAWTLWTLQIYCYCRHIFLSIWTFTIDKSICLCLASLYFLVLGFILPTYILDALIQVINLVEINDLNLKKSTIRKKVHLRKCNLHGIGQRSQAHTLFSKAQYRDHMSCMRMSCRAIMDFSLVPIEGRNQNNHSFFLAHHWWRPLASSTPPFSLIPWRKGGACSLLLLFGFFSDA